jgi:cobalt-zinc-cadmium efflux system outer membrane protein
MRRPVLILMMLLLSWHLSAQVMYLDSIKSIIEKNNPELQMYEAQSNALDAYAKGAKAWEAPQIGAGFFMTPYNTSMWRGDNSGGGTNGMGSSSKGMGSFMVQGQQMIPNPSKQRANQQYRQSMSAVEVANKNFVKYDLFTKAKTAYYEWVIAKQKMLVLDEQEQLMNYVIQTSEIRYQYRQEKLNSIYKAKAGLAEIINNRFMLESEINWKRIYLNQLMNRSKLTPFDVDTNIVVHDYEKMILDTSVLVSNRSDIMAIDKNILVAKYKLNYEKSSLKPDFGIQYAHMFTFGSNPNLFTLMGMVSIPIAPWSSGRYKSSSIGLSHEIQGYQKQREAIVNEAFGIAESLRWKIKNQKQQIEVYSKSILPALSKNYNTSLLAYEQNTEDLFIVIDALQALQMAKMELLNKKQELLLLLVDYEKTVEKK